MAIFLLLSQIVNSTSELAQDARNSSTSATILDYHVSADPFGPAIVEVDRGQQYFWSMNIQRTAGEGCYVTASWRWVLHLEKGYSVMWNSTDGEFFGGDKSEHLSQAFTVPEKLLPGKYTLSRLSKYKCGNMDEFARTVRTIDLIVRDDEQD